MLVVFSLSITPKRILHDLFAKHIDSKPGKNSSHLSSQVNKAGFNCDNDNLVAESSFLSELQIFSHPVFYCFSPYNFRHVSFPSVSGIQSRLRGPPVNI
jgi:hypothetical protein